MSPNTKKILEQVASWPEEDQDELAELAREIEARRTGIYVLSEEERAAITDARHSGFTPEADISAFWKRHGLG